MKKQLFILLIITLSGNLTFGQVTMRNDGKIVIPSGSRLIIAGSYRNDNAASITLDGVITVSGNWMNNSSTNVIANTGSRTDGEVIFNGSGTQTIGGTSSNVFDFEKLTINSGSTTQVTAGKAVTAYGVCTFTAPLVLKSTTTAYRPKMATFINESTVSGNITMELSYTGTGSSAAGSGRGLYFSSPISDATSTIFDVASGINLLWYQNEATRQYVKVTTNGTALTVAKGYILRAPTSQVFNFTGAPNTNSSYSNTNIPRAIIGQFYLMGNPYPAVVDWSLMSKTNLSGTIWYQTSTTTGSMVVDTWNGSIGTNNNLTSAVDNMIPPMQSFWVQCSAVDLTGSLTINNTNRSHSWGNSQFLKGSTSKPTNLNYTRYYLYTNDLRRDETIISQSDVAIDSLDDMDSRKMLLKDGVRAEIYSLSPEKTNLVIQSIKPIEKDKQIRLGVSIGTSGQYIFISNHDNSIRTCNIFLEDKTTKTMQDLYLNPEYIFYATAGDDTSRFVLHYLTFPNLNTKNSLVACLPDKADLTSGSVTEGSAPGLTYSYWSDKAATIPVAVPTQVEEGVYYIKATAANGSYKISDPIAVAIEPKPTVQLTNPTPVIYPATVDLTASSITDGSTSGLTYSYWLDANANAPYTTPQTAVAGNYYIMGTNSLTGCFTIAGPVVVTVLTSSNNEEINKISIYALNKTIVIENCEPKSRVTIFDITGKELCSTIAKSNKEVIPFNYNSGVYIIRLIDSKNIKSGKVYLQ